MTVEPGAAASDPNGLSRLLADAAVTGSKDLDQVLPVVYQELRAIAAAYVRQERAGHTLQPTALTHEAYLRLKEASEVRWKSRAHLVALAARAMRRTLVDHARARRTQKRGGEGVLVIFDAENGGSGTGAAPALDLLELDRALEELGENDERKLQIVEMLYFGGLTTTEASEVLEVSRRTVERDWRFARAWLLKRLHASLP